MYHHDISVNYQLPLNKIPIINFLSLNTRYSANFDWTSAPLALTDLGNNIQNSNNIQYNGQINMTTLYNKVPYFKKILASNKRKQKGRGRVSRTSNITENEEEKKKDRFIILKHTAKFILGVKNISVNLTQNKGTFIPGFLPEANFFGQNWAELSPGIPFVLGSQKGYHFCGQKGWITQNENINTLYKRTNSNNLVLRSTVAL